MVVEMFAVEWSSLGMMGKIGKSGVEENELC